MCCWARSETRLNGDVITGVVEEQGKRFTTTITPALRARRVVFEHACTCRNPACVHLAATLLAALDRFPALRKAQAQKNLFDALKDAPAAERQKAVFDLEPGTPPHACFVVAALVGERSFRRDPITPAALLADPSHGAQILAIARLLGGDTVRTGVSAALLPELLPLLLKSGQARWGATGKRLTAGETRVFDANTQPKLPPRSAVLVGNAGPWYVDAATGATGPVKLRQAPRPAAPPPRPTPARAGRRQRARNRPHDRAADGHADPAHAQAAIAGTISAICRCWTR